MDLRKFRQFVAVAEEQSFTAAATRLFIAQSALSTAISTLEAELGARLFERGRRGAALTSAGSAFLEPAREAIRAVERAKATATGLRPDPSLHIVNTFVSPPMAAERCAATLQDRHPGVEITLTHYGLGDVASLITDGEADIALAPIGRHTPIGICSEPLSAAPVDVICPPGHRLDGANGLSTDDLAGETIITLPKRSPFGKLTNSIATGPGRPRIRTIFWLNALNLVRQGCGITLGPFFHDASRPAGIAVGHFRDPAIMRSGVLTKEDPHHQGLINEYIKLYHHECRRMASAVA